jgi:hypothetical protein
MQKVQICRQYYENKLCWVIFPEETTCKEKYKDKTAVPLGVFKTKKLALAFCQENQLIITTYTTRLVP